MIRDAPWYRKAVFDAGLLAAGYEVTPGAPRGRPGDVLVIWNRYGGGHDVACRFEREGGVVLVAENGYLNPGGGTPKFDVHTKDGPTPDDHYAIGLGYHNDAGCWPAGGPERWDALRCEVRPWRSDGAHVLVLPNRSFGIPGRMMPADWPDRTAEKLRRATRREVRVRAHPGNDRPARALSVDLEGAWAAVVWSSSAGVHALLAGVPTFCEAPAWSMKDAASYGPIDDPTLPDRLPAFRRLAWGQWRVREIEAGAPFRALLP